MKKKRTERNPLTPIRNCGCYGTLAHQPTLSLSLYHCLSLFCVPPVLLTEHWSPSSALLFNPTPELSRAPSCRRSGEFSWHRPLVQTNPGPVRKPPLHLLQFWPPQLHIGLEQITSHVVELLFQYQDFPWRTCSGSSLKPPFIILFLRSMGCVFKCSMAPRNSSYFTIFVWEACWRWLATKRAASATTQPSLVSIN